MLSIYLSLALATCYAVVIGYIMLDHGGGSDGIWSLLVFFIWVISPQLVLYLAVAFARSQRKKYITLGLQALLGGLSLYEYYDNFYVHIDPQSGLLFLFFPVLQYVAILAAACIGVITSAASMTFVRLRKKHDLPSPR